MRLFGRPVWSLPAGCSLLSFFENSNTDRVFPNLSSFFCVLVRRFIISLAASSLAFLGQIAESSFFASLALPTSLSTRALPPPPLLHSLQLHWIARREWCVVRTASEAIEVNWVRLCPGREKVVAGLVEQALGRCTLQTSAARGPHSSHDTESRLNVVKSGLGLWAVASPHEGFHSPKSVRFHCVVKHCLLQPRRRSLPSTKESRSLSPARP
ncbi:hypothetical protein B0T24DRAFT_346625 [Lasiosphaeria ovina]|uniref:Uncharacterized protein n=1 Tax=Lasiosphaeria ovina TaxID=92902 RepID=A0AAE0N346_9PEZI|nr:hypothetical protein B0T24DRAFT_346625 [Lasiosphaeria ovina]